MGGAAVGRHGQVDLQVAGAAVGSVRRTASETANSGANAGGAVGHQRGPAFSATGGARDPTTPATTGRAEASARPRHDTNQRSVQSGSTLTKPAELVTEAEPVATKASWP